MRCAPKVNGQLEAALGEHALGRRQPQPLGAQLQPGQAGNAGACAGPHHPLHPPS